MPLRSPMVMPITGCELTDSLIFFSFKTTNLQLIAVLNVEHREILKGHATSTNGNNNFAAAKKHVHTKEIARATFPA